MSGASLTALVEISIRALALGLIGGLAALALRRAGSHVRHAVWLAVIGAMLALPLVSLLAPPLPVTIAYWTVAAPAGELPIVPVVNVPAPGRPVTPPWRPDWQMMLWAAYFLGVAAGAARMVSGARRLRRLVGASSLEYLDLLDEIAPGVGVDPAAVEIRSAEAVQVPFTAGVLRPVVLLPADWREWPRAKLVSVLAHEAAHIARRDWFTARLAAANRCLFWFHPLAWWLERKLASLAEESADQTALAVVNDPRSYAGAILDFAFAMQARRLHSMEATAMARSTKVGRRVERILSTSHFSIATFRRGVAPLIALCAIPVLYAAAALTPAPRVAAMAQAARPGQVYVNANLSDEQALQLESRIEQEPADLGARMRLLGYYQEKGNREKLAQHAWWLAENHPGRVEALFASMMLAEFASDSEKIRLRNLWSRPSENPAVLVNAGQVMQTLGRPFDAEDCFQRARRLAAGDSRYASALATLYARALRTNDPPAGEWTMFANRVKAELDITPDAALVGAVGEMLIGGKAPGRQELAEKYLKRAETLDGGNERWKSSLARLKGTPNEAKPAAGAPPERIRVGGNVQQDKLVNKVPLVYPPLAKQARIQGTVRFSATIGKDGDVKNLEAVSGHPLLVPAALESVKQWVYRPTLLNGMPVEVVTQIDVNFTLNGEAPAGVVGGVPGGVVGGVGRAYRVGDGVAAPKVVRKVEPQYPEALRHQGLSATVVLRVVISSDGKIGSALIERIDGQPAFGAAAIEAVRQWEFKPGMKDGQPVNVEATIEMNFRET
jgi:TonB family protein